jgi:hypothetical protein
MKSIFAVLLLLISGTAFADSSHTDVYIDTNLISKHFFAHNDDGTPYNEKNFGLGATIDFGRIELKGGYYKNSYFKHTNYGVLSYDFNSYSISENWSVNGSFGLGGVYGYRYTNAKNFGRLGDWQLGILPEVIFMYQPLKVRTSLAIVGNAVGLQVSLPLINFRN